ncbi:ATP-binding protein [Terrabacter sp. BE26]|uniref:ATP-binding protein n=1 Tax=Terrabacter sp. BE26 TaxID=2898152 RepID=UPI0035BE3BB9
MTPHQPDGDIHSGAEAGRQSFAVPSGQGEMQERFAQTDWSATPLGPVDTWPSNLRVLVDVCLSSRFPMLICWGPDLLMLYNDGYRNILGPNKHPGAWTLPVRAVWPEVWDVIGPMFDSVTSGGPATWVEDALLVVNRAGFLEEAYFTWSYGAIHDDDGRVVGVLNVATETTAKVVAERRANVSAALVETLADARSAEDVRRRALAVLGSHTHDHVTADIRWTDPGEAAGHGDMRVEADEVVHVVPIVEPGLVEPTAQLLLTDNARRPWDAQLQVYAELCASHVAMALSGIRHLQEERRRNEVLAELDVAKTDFFANVSHELRTPLTLIAGPVTDALAADGLDPEQRERFELISRNTERLTGLVDRILDLTRVEAGAVEPHWVEADIKELTTGVAANFRPAIERAGLEFEVVCDGCDHVTYVDVDMFERVVLNLLANALKFTPRGRISLRLQSDLDGYEVSVTDTGIGIAEKDLDLVFDRFRQLGRGDDRRSREGAGIGLSLVRQLVELLGGTVTVRSTQGEGSRFTVALPWGRPSVREALRPSIRPRSAESFILEASTWVVRDDVAARMEPTAPTSPGRGSSEITTTGPAAQPSETVTPFETAEPAETVEDRPTLLVVEDNHDMREYIARHVVNDYDVVSAQDGIEALEQLRLHRPSLVLADVMMPRMDGLTLVREIRSDPALRDLPVVLLSARAGVEASTTGLLEGADDYVVKPFDPQELRARLAANLVRSRSRSRDAAWLRAIVGAISEPFVITDADGRVVDMNAAFTRTFGWSLADGPLVPPYPWWAPTEGAADDARSHEERLAQLQAGQAGFDDRYRILRRGGGEAWVHARAACVPSTDEHAGFIIVVVRDETREHESRLRRELAARIAVDLARAEELDQALATAVTGFTVLFDGEVTLSVSPTKGQPVVLCPRGRVTTSELDPAVRRGLKSSPFRNDVLVGEKREGLLLLPTAQESDCRAWVQFDEPRLVSSDELVVGDLLAQSLGQAVDRVIALQARTQKERQLEQAIESHRLIGHAVGVLIERHRITAQQGFEMLRRASLNRNIKLRELATRVVETGQDPDSA